jgi:hypothetical protein
MVFKLPIFEPRVRKQLKQLDTYTKHIVSSKKSSGTLLILLGVVVILLIIFSPQLTKLVSNSKSSSSLSSMVSNSSASVEPTTITITNSFNQKCSLILSSPLGIPYTSITKELKEQWFKPTDCAIEGLKAVRAINTNLITETNPSVTWSHPTLNFSLLAYTSSPNQITKESLSRYQYQLSADVINKSELFNTSKIQFQFQNGTITYFLDGQCTLQTKECGLWKQQKIQNSIERLVSIDTTKYPAKFAQFQKNGTLIVYQKVSEESTQIINIDEEDPNVVLKKVYLNTDSVLDNYIAK